VDCRTPRPSRSQGNASSRRHCRSLELEAAPDADTPRPVGVGLLLCMLERGGEGPGRALIDLAASLQVGCQGWA
jgi:hypothetical protein